MIQKPRIIPRGIRNNNPLNIRIGNTWLGERAHPTDDSFEEFVTMQYGIRAAFIILRRYIRRYHKNTVPAIISTWAPASENNTQRYIDTVCKLAKLTPEQVIDFADETTMIRLVDAMAFVECGQHVDLKVIQEGYKMT